MFKIIRKKYNNWLLYKQDLKQNSTTKYYIIDWTETILVALVFALIIRQYVIQTSVVPSGSMIPTIEIGDRLFVSKYDYKFRAPKRGEIIVFKSPDKDGKDFVKRCIGLPGEKVELKDGIVFINDTPLIFPDIVINRDHFNYGPVIIPPNNYFMLGDNRPYSRDSRFWGFVPKEDLVGKALFTFYPFSRMRPLR